MTFEFFVALRYLRARRKEAVISIITAISIIGVAAGVMALVVSLAINNGFRSTLQRNLLGATAHVNILSKEAGVGIDEWQVLSGKLRSLPHVTSVEPVLYGQVFINGPAAGKGIVLKGVITGSEQHTGNLLQHLKEGSLTSLRDADGLPGIILGARLASDAGLVMNSRAMILSPQGPLTPFGPSVGKQNFRVVGIFESGFYDTDDNWAYASMENVQKLLSLRNVVNAIELRLDDVDRAPEVAKEAEKTIGNKYAASPWEEQNQQIMKALNMERIVTVITIGLIELIAALNILITLVMMVMEKYRDIAILISMGTRRAQIRRIFVVQGLLIGTVGTVIGLTIGYAFCYLANRYQLIPLDAQVYALNFVPFEPRWLDGLRVAAVAILVSYCATIYPARSATRIAPAEVLRYE